MRAQGSEEVLNAKPRGGPEAQSTKAPDCA